MDKDLPSNNYIIIHIKLKTKLIFLKLERILEFYKKIEYIYIFYI
jgi:hypothetical protein